MVFSVASGSMQAAVQAGLKHIAHGKAQGSLALRRALWPTRGHDALWVSNTMQHRQWDHLEQLFADSFEGDLGSCQALCGSLLVVTCRPRGAPPAALALPELYPLQLGPAALP